MEFLNAQMPNIEVLAVEIKRFHGKSAQTLVPRVIGRTAAPGSRRSRPARPPVDARIVPRRVRGRRRARRRGAPSGCGDAVGRRHLLRGIVWPEHSSEMLGLATTDHRCLAVLAAGEWMDAHPGLLVRGGRRRPRALPEELRAMLERWVERDLRRAASPKTFRARASRHGRSGTRRAFSTRTFWWNVFAASFRNWRRCDCLREFVVWSFGHDA